MTAWKRKDGRQLKYWHGSHSAVIHDYSWLSPAGSGSRHISRIIKSTFPLAACKLVEKRDRQTDNTSQVELKCLELIVCRVSLCSILKTCMTAMCVFCVGGIPGSAHESNFPFSCANLLSSKYLTSLIVRELEFPSWRWRQISFVEAVFWKFLSKLFIDQFTWLLVRNTFLRRRTV